MILRWSCCWYSYSKNDKEGVWLGYRWLQIAHKQTRQKGQTWTNPLLFFKKRRRAAHEPEFLVPGSTFQSTWRWQRCWRRSHFLARKVLLRRKYVRSRIFYSVLHASMRREWFWRLLMMVGWILSTFPMWFRTSAQANHNVRPAMHLL